MSRQIKSVETEVLAIAYEEAGDPGGEPVVLLHGFPDGVRAWDAVVAPLAAAGHRTLAPSLRGFGPTRFLDAGTPRSGQLAALGQDVVDFADGLGLDRFVLVGHDWGAQAAQAAAALQPERVARLVSLSRYALAFGAGAAPPPLDQIHALWYQWLLTLDLGRTLLATDRRAFCHYLWRTWSPCWDFPEDVFAAVAPSFDNPDFVDVVVHKYRQPPGIVPALAPADPRYAEAEALLATAPPIKVPTIVLQGTADGVDLLWSTAETETASHADHFPNGYQRRLVEGAGHFVHRERPEVVVEAILGRAP